MPFFGRPSLVRMSLSDSFKAARMFKGFFPEHVVDRSRHLDASPPPQVIAHLEPMLEAQPGNWLLRYTIGDWYMRGKRYRDALRVLLEAYSLRPHDPRSTYAVATAYRVLARASLEGLDIRRLFPAEYLMELRTQDPSIFRLLMVGLGDFDPTVSADELEHLKLTTDEVAQKAMEYFEETLRLGVRHDERHLVEQSLQSMYSEFPQLEAKVKARRRNDTGLFAADRRGAGGIWNEAKDHFTRLRYLTGNRPRYRYELGEVIRLCQWTIAADARFGDAYVLLANAYSLLDAEVSSPADDPHLYLKWSASLLQHWADTPLRNYPFTKNIEIGHTLYRDIMQQMSRLQKLSPPDLAADVRGRAPRDVPVATSPATFASIREALECEPLD